MRRPALFLHFNTDEALLNQPSVIIRKRLAGPGYMAVFLKAKINNECIKLYAAATVVSN
jgi:hypothetical protein